MGGVPELAVVATCLAYSCSPWYHVIETMSSFVSPKY